MAEQRNKRLATVVVRSTGLVFMWLVATALACAGIFLLRHVEPWRGFVGVGALFCAQGFIAELAGFRVGPNGVSFPRRIFPGVAFPTLWRRRVPAKEISRIDSLGDRAALFYLNSTERVAVVFPHPQSRRIFLRHLDAALEARRSTRNPALDRCHGAKQISSGTI